MPVRPRQSRLSTSFGFGTRHHRAEALCHMPGTQFGLRLKRATSAVRFPSIGSAEAPCRATRRPPRNAAQGNLEAPKRVSEVAKIPNEDSLGRAERPPNFTFPRSR
jgi:hypothetical protein